MWVLILTFYTHVIHFVSPRRCYLSGAYSLKTPIFCSKHLEAFLFLLTDRFRLCSTSLQVMFHTFLWLCEGLKIDFLKQIPEQGGKRCECSSNLDIRAAYLSFICCVSKHQTASNSVCNVHVLARLMVRWNVNCCKQRIQASFSGNGWAWFDTKDKYYKVLHLFFTLLHCVV